MNNNIHVDATYTYQGRHYTIEKRTGDVAIATAGEKDWEVFVIQHRPDKEMFGNIIPAHEAIPATHEWGSNSWSYTSEAGANKKFDELVEKI